MGPAFQGGCRCWPPGYGSVSVGRSASSVFLSAADSEQLSCLKPSTIPQVTISPFLIVTASVPWGCPKLHRLLGEAGRPPEGGLPLPKPDGTGPPPGWCSTS